MNITPDALPNGDTPPNDGAPANERPDWLPEKFWTPEGPKFENLAKSYGELESQRGTLKETLRAEWDAERTANRPESADKYELPQSDALDTEAMASSPLVQWWRGYAFEQGLPNDQFQAAISTYAEQESARIEAFAAEQVGLLGENAKARTEAVGLWAKKLFGESDKFNAIAQVCSTAAGIEAIEQLMDVVRQGGGDPSAFDGNAGEPEESEADIRKLMDTPEYWDSKRRDPAVVKKVEAFYAKKYAK